MMFPNPAGGQPASHKGRIMLKTVIACLALVASSVVSAAVPQVELKTNTGTIVIELYPDRAPETVKNFQQYVESGHYNGTVFHRVIPGFMIQGGGFTADLGHKPTREPIKNEANNGLKNVVGTIAMARTREPHSATSQFFINVADNPALDFQDGNFGYCVFGKVVSGMDVVQRIVAVPTTARGPHQNVPVKPVVIESARMLEAAGAKPARKPAK
jgi:peptidyl-prolyl cis-trans isomerase A (cyclophilin A)